MHESTNTEDTQKVETNNHQVKGDNIDQQHVEEDYGQVKVKEANCPIVRHFEVELEEKTEHNKHSVESFGWPKKIGDHGVETRGNY